MTALLLLLALTLQDLGRTLAAHPAFTARFEQKVLLPSGETLKDKGTAAFVWGKGLRFDYAGTEKKGFVFSADGFYSRQGEGEWNFQAWDPASPEMLPFAFMLDGRVPETVDWTVTEARGEVSVASADPAFTLTLDRRTGWPRRLIIPQADGSSNTLDFSGHRAEKRELMP